MFTLSLKDSGELLGTIDDADLQLLVDQLEEEHEMAEDVKSNETVDAGNL